MAQRCLGARPPRRGRDKKQQSQIPYENKQKPCELNKTITTGNLPPLPGPNKFIKFHNNNSNYLMTRNSFCICRHIPNYRFIAYIYNSLITSQSLSGIRSRDPLHFDDLA